MRQPQSFYAQPTRRLAKALLGCKLVRHLDGQRVAGIIVETEAYIGETDLACHARAGRTARTAVMYGRPGLAYVYFTYGLHWLLNVVSEREDFPAAVLIRAIEPVEGVELMQAARGPRPMIDLANGPAKLCQALRIDQALNGVDLTDARSDVWIEADRVVPARSIQCGPRVGIGRTPEPWLSKPWRYWVKESAFVSK
ncbi:MAG: DNA-3-methyladenine glycosylase [Thermoflexales bacterium]|nr:DNA-3-methyladenine glycosylase [Thermoflexales bacterium]